MVLGTAGSTFAREASFFGGVHLTMLKQNTYFLKKIEAYGNCTFISPYSLNLFRDSGTLRQLTFN